MTLEQMDDKLSETIAKMVCWPSVLFGTDLKNSFRNFSLILFTSPVSLALAAPLIMAHIMLYFIIEKYNVDDK